MTSTWKTGLAHGRLATLSLLCAAIGSSAVLGAGGCSSTTNTIVNNTTISDAAPVPSGSASVPVPVPPPDAGGPGDSQAPTQEVTGIYFGSCLSALSVGDLNKVLRFYTEVRFVPDVAGGKLDLQLTPMKGVDFASGQPVPTPPSSVSKSQAFGAPFGVKGSPVSPTGRFAVTFSSVVLDRNANPISGREITINDMVLDGNFATPGRFCTTLQGKVTQPIVQVLDPAENVCVFVPVKDGDPVPEVKRAEYTCPKK